MVPDVVTVVVVGVVKHSRTSSASTQSRCREFGKFTFVLALSPQAPAV